MNSKALRDIADSIPTPWLVSTLFVSLTLGQSIYRISRIRLGKQQPHFDFRHWWGPIGQKVVDGVPLYVGGATDSKPPVFMMANVLFSATGLHATVFLLLIGLANGLIAVLIWQLFRRRDSAKTGIVAGFLFVSSLPMAQGTVIQIRSFAMLGVVASLLSPKAAIRGGLLALGALVHQYAILAAPVVVFDRIHSLERKRSYEWLFVFSLSGLLVVLLSFLTVYLVWGTDSLIGAVHWSFGAVSPDGIPGGYITTRTENTPWNATVVWANNIVRIAVQLFHIIIPAAMALFVTLRRLTRRGTWGLEESVAALTILMFLPFVLRGYLSYWVYPLPFLCMLAAITYERFVGVREESV